MKITYKEPIKPKSPYENIDNPVGWWEVTTEGDCEGKSTKLLGVHYGHVAGIALSLGNKGGYSLSFYPAKQPKDVTETPKEPEEYIAVTKEIHIHFPNGIYSINIVEKFLNTNLVTVSESKYYKSVKLTLREQT
jgi:hypothetical protein